MALKPAFPGPICKELVARLAVYEPGTLGKEERLLYELLADLDRALMEREAVKDEKLLNRLSFSSLNEYKESLIERFEGDIKILELQIERLQKEIASSGE